MSDNNDEYYGDGLVIFGKCMFYSVFIIYFLVFMLDIVAFKFIL